MGAPHRDIWVVIVIIGLLHHRWVLDIMGEWNLHRLHRHIILLDQGGIMMVGGVGRPVLIGATVGVMIGWRE
jgi:hypothetical protein